MSSVLPSSLAAKLADLKERRDKRERLKDEASDAERSYRSLEAEVIEDMLTAEPPLTSVRADGIGLFVIQTRNYISPQDYAAVVRWAAEDGLIHQEGIDFLTGECIIRFQPVTEIDDESGDITTRLVSGAFRLDAKKAVLADHARQKLADEMVELDGLKTSTSRFIQIRK